MYKSGIFSGICKYEKEEGGLNGNVQLIVSSHLSVMTRTFIFKPLLQSWRTWSRTDVHWQNATRMLKFCSWNFFNATLCLGSREITGRFLLSGEFAPVDYGLPFSEYLRWYFHWKSYWKPELCKPGPGRWLLTGPRGRPQALSFQLQRPIGIVLLWHSWKHDLY